jgi:hypothetical protein
LNPQQECIAYKELAVTPFVAYVGDEVADKIWLLRPVHEDDENDEVNGNRYASGPEDGEDVMNEFNQDAFASL